MVNPIEISKQDTPLNISYNKIRRQKLNGTGKNQRTQPEICRDQARRSRGCLQRKLRTSRRLSLDLGYSRISLLRGTARRCEKSEMGGQRPSRAFKGTYLSGSLRCSRGKGLYSQGRFKNLPSGRQLSSGTSRYEAHTRCGYDVRIARTRYLRRLRNGSLR